MLLWPNFLSQRGNTKTRSTFIKPRYFVASEYLVRIIFKQVKCIWISENYILRTMKRQKVYNISLKHSLSTSHILGTRHCKQLRPPLTWLIFWKSKSDLKRLTSMQRQLREHIKMFTRLTILIQSKYSGSS